MTLFSDDELVNAALMNGNLEVLAAGPTVLSASQPSITLAVPTGFNRLKIRWRARSDQATTAEQLYLRFNGDTSSDYLWEVNQANNTSVAGTTSGGTATSIQIGTIPCASATAGYFGSGEGTADGVSTTSTGFTTYQGSGCGFVTSTSMYNGTYSGQWNQSGAVTSVTIYPSSGNLVAGSSLSIYGLM